MSSPQDRDYLEVIQSLKAEAEPFVVVTLVNHVGSAPQNIGARAIVNANGLIFGTVGGGKVENRALAEAKEMIITGNQFHFVEWNLQKDIGMTCGGVVKFFFELYKKENSFHIAVFGAGHIAQSFIPLLLNLDCQVTCLDSRKEWLEKLPDSRRLTKVFSADLCNEVSTLPQQSYVTIMTMGHATDLPILVEVLKQRERFAYVGNIGSQQKSLRLKKDLHDSGVEVSAIEKFYCPMGENFGSNSPVEISFSIIAQILKIRDQI